MAADAFERPELLEDASKAADFILARQLKTGADPGSILAYEVMAEKVDTSAVSESL